MNNRLLLIFWRFCITVWLVLAVVYWITIYWWLWILVGDKADRILDKTFDYLCDKIDTYEFKI